MDSQRFKPDLRRLLATQLHKPLSTWSHQCTLETHSETFTPSCMLRTFTESLPDTRTHSETFTHSPTRKYIHTFRHLHTSSCRQHPHVQGQTQRHTLAHSNAFTETQKEHTQAQGYSGTLRGIRARGHTKTPSVTHILAHLSTFSQSKPHTCMHTPGGLWNIHGCSVRYSTARYSHTVSPAHRCSHHHPLQPTGLNALSTHFPPSSGASGASLRSWGRGWGGVCPADVATLLTCGWPHPLHGERLKGAGIPRRYKPTPPNPGLCPCFSDAKSEV